MFAGRAQLSDNTPPVMWLLDRDWRVPSTERPGEVVTRVKARDNEDDQLTFGLAPPDNFGHFPGPAPFTVDPTSGVVTVNDSLTSLVSIIYTVLLINIRQCASQYRHMRFA